MSIKLVDAEGITVAFYIDNEWVCPFGGTFTPKDVRDMMALLAGEIDDWTFGCPGIRVVSS